MKSVFDWITKYRGALYVSVVYGIIAGLISVIGRLGGGDGPVGAWLVIYYSAWPVSFLFVAAASLMEGYLSASVFNFVYTTSPILAGMVWFYFLSRCFFAIKAKLKQSP
jgi:hypothetical protein